MALSQKDSKEISFNLRRSNADHVQSRRCGSRSAFSIPVNCNSSAVRIAGHQGEETMSRIAFAAAFVAAFFIRIDGVSAAGSDVRLTNDCHPDAGCGAGYVSAYTLASGNPYTDKTLRECTISHGRQNEPAVAVDPRNTSVLLGSSNDYCPVYNEGIAAGAVGPIWLGYYRSLGGGASWTS